MENTNKPVYKITVETIDQGGQPVVSDVLRNGMECSGFALIALHDDGTTVAVQNTNPMALAEVFSREGALAAAAHIGKAMREAENMVAKAEANKTVRGVLDAIFNKMAENEASEA